MSEPAEESKEQLLAPSTSATPVFHRRTLAPAPPLLSPNPSSHSISPSPSPHGSAHHPTPLDTLPSTPRVPPPPSLPAVEEDDDVSRLTDLDIAAIPIPLPPPYPTALLDPPSTLSPTLSPTSTPRGGAASNAAASTTLRTLLTPYLTAYTSSQHTLSSSFSSLTHLHSKCTADATSAVKSCTKKALALSNWSDVQHHVRLVSDRLGKCQADVERCLKEVGLAKDGVAFIKDHLTSYAQHMQAECQAWVAQEEEKVKAAELLLEGERTQADARQAELLTLRTANISAFQRMDETRQAVQAEEDDLARVSTERHRVDALCAQLQGKRAWLEERIQHTQQSTADRQKAAVEGEERCAQLKKEVVEMTAVVGQQQQRLQAVQEEEAVVQAEERAMSDSVRLEKAEVDRSNADVALVQLRLNSERQECQQAQRERRKKRQMYQALTQAVRALKDELDEWEALKRDADLGIARVSEAEQHATSRLLRAQQGLGHVQSERGLLERGVEWAERGEKKSSTMLKLRRAQLPHLQAEEAQAQAKVRLKLRERQRIVDDCQAVTTKLQLLKDGVAGMQAQVDDDRALAADVAHETSRLQGKLQRQSAVLEEVEEERSHLRRRVCDLATAMLREKQRMEGKRREVDDWKKRITRVDKDRQQCREQLVKLQGVHGGVQLAITRVGERREGKVAANAALATRLSHLSSLHTTCIHEHDLERHQLQSIVGEERVLQATLIRRQSDAAQAWEALHTLKAKTEQARAQSRQQRTVRRRKEAEREEWQRQLTAALQDCEEARHLDEQVRYIGEQLTVEQMKRQGMEEEAKRAINVHRSRVQRDERHPTFALGALKRQHRRQLQELTEKLAVKQKELTAQLHTYQQLAQHTGGGVGREEGGKVELAGRCKALKGALGVAREQKVGLDREMEELQRRKQAVVLEWLQTRQEEERKERELKRKEQQMMAEGGAAHGVDEDEGEDGYEVLRRRSFAVGEEYDEAGNRIVEEEHKEAQLTMQ